jgi:hypothetical protein
MANHPDAAEPTALRPGLALPVLGYLGAAASTVVALIFAYAAYSGGEHAGPPPAGDWHALPARLLVGLVGALFAWFFYKLGSQRVVLGTDTMRIVSWGLVWTIRRDEIAKVTLTPASMIIILTDGKRIRPSMFWSSGTGMIAVRAGRFANFSSRTTIAEAIRAWRRMPAATGPAAGQPAAAAGTRWRTRLTLLPLVTLAIVVAAEAVLVTAFLR